MKHIVIIAAAAPFLCAVHAPSQAQTICGTWSDFPGPDVGGPIQSPWIYRIIEWDAGSGPSLVIAGRFEGADPAIRNIARWDGQSYQAFGGGLGSSIGGEVRDVAVFDDGGGPALYAAGQFTTNPSGSSPGFARWNGTAWVNPLAGQLFFGEGDAMAVHDDGAGPALFVRLGSALIRYSAGAATLVPGAPGITHSMTSFDDGTGAALYVGGYFTTAGGIPVSSLARLQNGTWSDVGGGVQSSGTANGTVYRLRVLDDGGDPALFVAGQFFRVQGAFTLGVARWKDGAWTTYPTGPGFVSSGAGGRWDVGMLDTTSPPTLLLAAPFLRIMPTEGPEIEGGLLAYTPIGGWVAAGPPGHVGTYALFWESPDRLLVAGRLEGDPPLTMAAWSPCPACYANCDGSTAQPVLNVDDFTCFIISFAQASALPPERQVAHYANCDGSTAPPVLNGDDFTCFINAFAAGCP